MDWTELDGGKWAAGAYSRINKLGRRSAREGDGGNEVIEVHNLSDNISLRQIKVGSAKWEQQLKK